MITDLICISGIPHVTISHLYATKWRG